MFLPPPRSQKVVVLWRRQRVAGFMVKRTARGATLNFYPLQQRDRGPPSFYDRRAKGGVLSVIGVPGSLYTTIPIIAVVRESDIIRLDWDTLIWGFPSCGGVIYFGALFIPLDFKGVPE